MRLINLDQLTVGMKLAQPLFGRTGRLLLTNGWSDRAQTKGSIGRMQGLRMVSAPPRYAMRRRSMEKSSVPADTY